MRTLAEAGIEVTRNIAKQVDQKGGRLGVRVSQIVGGNHARKNVAFDLSQREPGLPSSTRPGSAELLSVTHHPTAGDPEITWHVLAETMAFEPPIQDLGLRERVAGLVEAVLNRGSGVLILEPTVEDETDSGPEIEELDLSAITLLEESA